MQYRANRSVNLGGGHFITEGQTVEMPAGTRIQGLEPVLERGPEAPTLERTEAGRNLDAPGRLRVVNG